MTLTDYKFSNILHLTDGGTQALVRFYQGDITTELEEGPDGVLAPVTRYRRPQDGLLRVLTHTEPGRVSTDDLRDAMNVELATDPVRTPVDEQKEVPPKGGL